MTTERESHKKSYLGHGFIENSCLGSRLGTNKERNRRSSNELTWYLMVSLSKYMKFNALEYLTYSNIYYQEVYIFKYLLLRSVIINYQVNKINA